MWNFCERKADGIPAVVESDISTIELNGRAQGRTNSGLQMLALYDWICRKAFWKLPESSGETDADHL